MKKAGMITFHNAENYGAALQTYGLMKTLQNLGCDAQVIDYRNRGVFLRNMVKSLFYFFTLQNPFKNHRVYKKFQAQYQNLTPRTYRSFNEFVQDADQFDVLFFGSDQIWNPDLSNGFDPFYFGQFPTKAKKVAYAASFGRDQITDDERGTLNQLLENFDAISIREESMLPVIDYPAECVVDPCMLLSADDWSRIASKEVNEANFILVYQLHPQKEILQTALTLAEQHQKKILLISPYPVLTNRKTIHKLGRITPNEFLAYYKQADHVVSDSFHGTVFSVIFTKQFHTVLPSVKTGRLTSLLRKLNLTDQIVTQDQITPAPIDYARINTLVVAEIKTSLDYIRRNLP